MLKEQVTRLLLATVRRLPKAVVDELYSRATQPPPSADLALSDLPTRVETLEKHAYTYDTLFYKAFGVAGLGDYLEFGVYTGGSLSAAYRAARAFYQLSAIDKVWGDDGGEGQRRWDAMRFVGFDSFKGLPAPEGVDSDRPVFGEGDYTATTEQVWASIERWDVDRSKVKLVEGYFEDTCTQVTATDLGLREVAVVHIDSDLYESAVTALDFCTPYFHDGSVVLFDEWFQFAASPEHGEQRAFGEWRRAHPEWHVAELAREGVGRVAFVLNRAA